MKREYVTPCAKEESFVPNQYVAACGEIIEEGIKCINPYHNSNNRQYGVKVSNDDYGHFIPFSGKVNFTDSCKYKVKNILDVSDIPSRGDAVYDRISGNTQKCTSRKVINGTTYYVPSFAPYDSSHYGPYQKRQKRTSS